METIKMMTQVINDQIDDGYFHFQFGLKFDLDA